MQRWRTQRPLEMPRRPPRSETLQVLSIVSDHSLPQSRKTLLQLLDFTVPSNRWKIPPSQLGPLSIRHRLDHETRLDIALDKNENSIQGMVAIQMTPLRSRRDTLGFATQQILIMQAVQHENLCIKKQVVLSN